MLELILDLIDRAIRRRKNAGQKQSCKRIASHDGRFCCLQLLSFFLRWHSPLRGAEEAYIPRPNQPHACQNSICPASIAESAKPSTKHTPKRTKLTRSARFFLGCGVKLRGKLLEASELRGDLFFTVSVGQLKGKMLLVFLQHIVCVRNAAALQLLRELRHKIKLRHNDPPPTVSRPCAQISNIPRGPIHSFQNPASSFDSTFAAGRRFPPANTSSRGRLP